MTPLEIKPATFWLVAQFQPNLSFVNNGLPHNSTIYVTLLSFEVGQPCPKVWRNRRTVW